MSHISCGLVGVVLRAYYPYEHLSARLSARGWSIAPVRYDSRFDYRVYSTSQKPPRKNIKLTIKHPMGTHNNSFGSWFCTYIIGAPSHCTYLPLLEELNETIEGHFLYARDSPSFGKTLLFGGQPRRQPSDGIYGWSARIGYDVFNRIYTNLTIKHSARCKDCEENKHLREASSTSCAYLHFAAYLDYR